MYYSSVDDVIKFTGVSYEKLGLGSQEELEFLIEDWLEYVTSLINQNRGRDLYRDLTFGDRTTLIHAEEKWTGDDVEIETSRGEFPRGLDVSSINKITPRGIGIVATKILNEDLSKAKVLEVYLRSYVKMGYGEVSILLYKDDEVLRTLKCPEMYEYEWRLCRFFLGRDSLLSSVDKIAISVDTNPIYLWIANVNKIEMPKAIDKIAMRACANLVNLAYVNRESPTITIENMVAKFPEDNVLTDSLKGELRQFPKKSKIVVSRVVGKYNDISTLPVREDEYDRNDIG